MKNMKRTLALSLSAALLLALLSACGDPNAGNSDPAGDPTGSPTQTVQPTPTPTPTPETPVDLSTFVGKLGDAYEFPMLESMPEEFISDRFPGLADLELPQCYYYAPMMTGVSTAEFVLVQAGSAADVDAVKAALQARIDAQNSPEAMLYPHEQEDWANNARVVANGNYVLMVANSNCDSIVADFNAFIADPSYVPAPNPNSGANDPVDDPNDNPGGIVPPGGGIVPPGGGIILPGGSDNPPAPSQSTGGNVYEPTGRTDSDKDLEAFLGSILGGEKYAFPGMGEPPAEWLDELFPGLGSVPVVQRLVYTPNATATAAALVLVQVENSSDVDNVKSILQEHVNIQMSRQANYIAVVESYQKNTRIESHGNYIMMVVHSSCDDIVADFNALF